MHFQIVYDDYYKNILKELKRIVPQFETVFGDDPEIYPVLGEFGRFIIKNLKNSEILTNSIVFINEAIESGGHETENAIVMQIFQQIYENQEISDEFSVHLSVKARSVFDKYKSLY